MENINFTHSSRRAWRLLRRLESGQTQTAIGNPPAPQAVATRLKLLSKPKISKETKISIKSTLAKIRAEQQQRSSITKPVTSEELDSALEATQCKKAAGSEDIYPEFIKQSCL